MPSAGRPLITANQVTLARLIPMPLLAWLIYRGAEQGYKNNPYMWAALIAGTLIGCTDWVDGLLARKYGPTVLGGLLDPIADKIFNAFAYTPFVDTALTETRQIAANMEERTYESLIMRYAALVSPAAMGFGLQALVEVTLEDHSEKTVEAFEAAIRARPEVVACYAVTGDMDFLLHVFATDLNAFSDFALKALLRMPGVKGTRSSFIMQAIKSDLAWAPAPRLK